MSPIKAVFASLLSIISVTLIAQQPRLVLPIGHTNNVQFESISPNGKYVVTVSSDKTAKLWEINTGRLLNTFTGFTGVVNSVEFSPDGTKIITGAKDGKVRIWDVSTGALLQDLKGHKQEIASVKFSPDGQYAVSASIDQSAKIWNVATGALIHSLEGHRSFVSMASFSTTGDYVLTASWDFTAKIWDTKTGQLVRTLTDSTKLVNLPLNFAYFSPGDKYVITASKDNSLSIWDAQSGKRIREQRKHTDEIRSACFINKGKYFVTSSYDHTAKVWETSTGDLVYDLVGHSDKVYMSSPSADGKYLVTASADATASIWDMTNGKLARTLAGHLSDVMSAFFTPDGKKVVTSSWDRTARVWNFSNGKTISVLKGHSFHSTSLCLDDKGQKLYTNTYDNGGESRVWDLSTLKLIKAFDYSVFKKSNVYFSSDINAGNLSHDGKLFAACPEVLETASGKLKFRLQLNDSASYSEGIFSHSGSLIAANTFIYKEKDPVIACRIWDAANGKLLHTLKGHRDMLGRIGFSPDDKKIVTTSWDGTAKVWETATGKLLFTLSGHTNKVMNVVYSPDGKYIATGSDDKNVMLWSATTGKLLHTLIGHPWVITELHFSADSKYLLSTCGGRGSNAILWEAETGRLIYKIGDEQNSVSNAAFSTKGEYVLISHHNSLAEIYETTTGKLVHQLKGHTDEIYSTTADKDDKFVYTVSRDDQLKCWDLKSGGLLYTFFAADSMDYFVQTPSGYYQSSQNAAKLLHYVTNDLKVLSFEQLDVKYNRPDKVLETIGNSDSTLIKSYRKAWEKRIKRLGIDTTAFREGFSVPECDFVNRDDIAFEQKNEKLVLHIKASDNDFNLDRFNVWINEVPVFGQRGIDLKQKQSHSLDTLLTVVLSEGNNNIETSITNVNGIESYRLPIAVAYMPATPQAEKLHFIGIGLDHFNEPKHDLNYSVKDVRDLAISLKKKYGAAIQMDTLFNEAVTTTSIAALKTKLLSSAVNDKVIVAYSGHGLLSKDFDYHLSTYDVNFSRPEEGGLPYDELEALLDGIPARKKLMLIDACHSGEVDKEEFQKIAQANEAAATSKGARGTTPLVLNSRKDGMKNSFELMQQLFVNVGRSTGATVISAAGGTQFALERGDLKNGVFTYSILEYMQAHPTASVSELKAYVNQRVPQLTKGAQQPTTRNETKQADWQVW
ncbi:caspase family protein [Flavisolibacter tropicus]|uniref:Peptidase C14 caspase domain-containing protein n=1 Tax=Flavisolibacter tropicus TaxID=1492898 RepID=A0A172TX64_9BACT|nr:caspase family protein [Flavisolibacter tropicus]ANE51373.1 hypothetical protein SY85_13515 [Flavisolibacter tropicus]